MRHLTRVRAQGRQLEAMLQDILQWQDMVRRDLPSVHRVSPKVQALPPPHYAMQPWAQLIAHAPRAWRAI
eukprot:15258198-Alexandrium_andersonii.AAC.1